ncbi:MAG: ComF family protein [Bacteroidaceae bacterium]|nr:ComF family protein [Bacteroidaceae bacterium]
MNSGLVWIKSLVEWLFPRYCAICGARLRADERAVCLHCLASMPLTGYHLWKENPVERLFWGKFPLERATAWMVYQRGTPYAKIIHQFKYGGRKTLAVDMGRMMAADLQKDGFFEGVDFIVPVPLHPRRLLMRGYNQSEMLAKGVSEITQIPILNGVVERIRYTETQTKKSGAERAENMKHTFRVADVNNVIGKHLLLVDDVVTTSSTLTACGDALQAAEGIRLSVLALASAE